MTTPTFEKLQADFNKLRTDFDTLRMSVRDAAYMLTKLQGLNSAQQRLIRQIRTILQARGPI